MGTSKLTGAACALTLAIAMMGLAFGAWAHSKMAASNPTDGSIVKQGLEHIRIGFQHPVRVTVVTVAAEGDGAGSPIVVKGTASPATSFEFAVPPLVAARYRVDWTAVASDGHVMKGRLSFTVAP